MPASMPGRKRQQIRGDSYVRTRITLFKMLGFAVRVDASWLIIAALIGLVSLQPAIFPYQLPDLPIEHIGGWASSGALTLRLRCHSRSSFQSSARQCGLTMKESPSSYSGGVARDGGGTPNPKAEVFVPLLSAGKCRTRVLVLPLSALWLRVVGQ